MHGTTLRIGVYSALLAGMLVFGPHVESGHAQEVRQEFVRMTYYLQRGVMADGMYVHRGAAACSQWLPFGTLLRLPDGYTVTCEDRGLGDLFWRAWTDVWVPDRASGQSLTRAFGDYVWVEVARWGWDD